MDGRHERNWHPFHYAANQRNSQEIKEHLFAPP